MPSWGCSLMEYRHIPVMLKETVRFLNCQPGSTIVDCTLGGTGHATAILEKIMPGGLLIGIDQDTDAIANAEQTLRAYASSTIFFHDNFSNLPKIFVEARLPKADGILADLGFSLHQIENSGRGFSFRKKEPLDMRMNKNTGVTAENLINGLPEKGLAELFQKWGQERYAKRIARVIVKERQKQHIADSAQLARIVTKAVPPKKSGHRLHPATRVFMALRIAVNREIEHLNLFLETALDYLAPGGRLCIISFHSLEDRLVKHRFKNLARGCTCPADFPQCVCKQEPQVNIITRKAVCPTAEEIRCNPMSRSARLRVVEKRMPASEK